MGHPPLILELLPNTRDDDHMLAVYRQDGCWGAVAQSNFTGLRYREPVFRSLRELVMSYFEQFYNTDREKTLRGYTLPINLKVLDSRQWMTRDAAMREIAGCLDRAAHKRLLTRKMVLGAIPGRRAFLPFRIDGGSAQGDSINPGNHNRRGLESAQNASSGINLGKLKTEAVIRSSVEWELRRK